MAMGGKNDAITIHDSIEVMNFRYHPQCTQNYAGILALPLISGGYSSMIVCDS